jgi:hypothetical protein
MSASFRDLQRLAEACWAQQPQDRPSFGDVFDYLEACMRGTPTADLLRRGSSGLSDSFLVSSPKVADVVDQQLQGLKHSAELQLRLVKQASGQGLVPIAAAVVNRGDIAWSEVTYCGLQDVYDMQPMQQNRQLPQLQRNQQQQELELQQSASNNATAAGGTPARPSNPADMDWSEVTYGNNVRYGKVGT